MALVFTLVLTAIVILYSFERVNDDADLATLSRMHEYEERMKINMASLQESWSWGQNKDWASRNQEVDEGIWDGWPYVGLIIFVLFGCCRHTIKTDPVYDSSSDDSSTATFEDLDDEDDSDLEPQSNMTRSQILEDFYNRHVKADTSDLTDMCSFVETFVNDLLGVCQGALPEQKLPLVLENCIGVGSAYEGWHIQEGSQPFQVLVPISPPRGHSFHLETSEAEGTPSNHGHIWVEMECLCKRERLLGDVVCPLHHPHSPQNNGEGPVDISYLCTNSHLEVDKTLRWFQALVTQAWEHLSYKYKLDFAPQPSNASCRLKLLFKSGRAVSIDLILGAQLGDTLAFLATQGAEKDRLTGVVWQRNLSVQEFLFFEWADHHLPEDSCHLRCLQLVIFMKESSIKKEPVLTDYQYKTCLMHLLLEKPRLDWGPEQIAPRLRDLLLFMRTALEEKYLPHFVVGNISLPIVIPIPQALRSAPPLNLFQHLERDRGLQGEAMKEFVEVVERLRALWSEREE